LGWYTYTVLISQGLCGYAGALFLFVDWVRISFSIYSETKYIFQVICELRSKYCESNKIINSPFLSFPSRPAHACNPTQLLLRHIYANARAKPPLRSTHQPCFQYNTPYALIVAIALRTAVITVVGVGVAEVVVVVTVPVPGSVHELSKNVYGLPADGVIIELTDAAYSKHAPFPNAKLTQLFVAQTAAQLAKFASAALPSKK
jgi:hypothetical protein